MSAIPGWYTTPDGVTSLHLESVWLVRKVDQGDFHFIEVGSVSAGTIDDGRTITYADLAQRELEFSRLLLELPAGFFLHPSGDTVIRYSAITRLETDDDPAFAIVINGLSFQFADEGERDEALEAIENALIEIH